MFSSNMEVEDSSWPYICVSRNPADDGDPISTNLKNFQPSLNMMDVSYLQLTFALTPIILNRFFP